MSTARSPRRNPEDAAKTQRDHVSASKLGGGKETTMKRTSRRRSRSIYVALLDVLANIPPMDSLVTSTRRCGVCA